jgi:hypothetical protein
MGDLFGLPPDEIRRCFREMAAEIAALKLLLIEKGLATADELDRLRPRVVAALDQAVAARYFEPTQEPE